MEEHPEEAGMNLMEEDQTEEVQMADPVLHGVQMEGVAVIVVVLQAAEVEVAHQGVLQVLQDHRHLHVAAQTEEAAMAAGKDPHPVTRVAQKAVRKAVPQGN